MITASDWGWNGSANKQVCHYAVPRDRWHVVVVDLFLALHLVVGLLLARVVIAEGVDDVADFGYHLSLFCLQECTLHPPEVLVKDAFEVVL